MAETLALVILGSGSTAFAAALNVAALGKMAVMTEARTLGGGTIRIRPVSPWEIAQEFEGVLVS